MGSDISICGESLRCGRTKRMARRQRYLIRSELSVDGLSLIDIVDKEQNGAHCIALRGVGRKNVRLWKQIHGRSF